VCFKKNTSGFNLDYLEANYIYSFEDINIGVTQTKQCKKCLTNYYCSNKTFRPLTDEQKSMLETWNCNKLKLTNEHFKIVNEIGLSKYWNDSKGIPCRVKLTNGEEIDFCTLIITSKLPIHNSFKHYKRTILISEIDSISESEYGLSQSIREKANRAQERRMGFYPTVLKHNNKLIVTRSENMNFFTENIKGSELENTQEQWSHNDNNYTYEIDLENQTLIVACE